MIYGEGGRTAFRRTGDLTLTKSNRLEDLFPKLIEIDPIQGYAGKPACHNFVRSSRLLSVKEVQATFSIAKATFKGRERESATMRPEINDLGARPGSVRVRARDIDRHIGARLRQRRIASGLTQQRMADLIGVTYQQAHKYESGSSRIAAGRLYLIANVLGVEVGYFFEGLHEKTEHKPAPQQRVFLELARNFRSIRTPKHQEAICALTRILANLENASEETPRDAQSANRLKCIAS